jgi:hypothetical protein
MNSKTGRYQKSSDYFQPHIKNKHSYRQENYQPNNNQNHENFLDISSPIDLTSTKVTSANVTSPNVTSPNVTSLDVTSPDVWGPMFWFTLHNGAINYPEYATGHYKKRMTGFIKGIPYMIPCKKCKEHATQYIEDHKDRLDSITSSRKNLFEFFFQFHNVVNKRLNKPEISIEKAYEIYDVKS